MNRLHIQQGRQDLQDVQDLKKTCSHTLCASLLVGAKRRSRYRGPACPVAPADGTGVKFENHLTGAAFACPVKFEDHFTGAVD